jgi:hypothetical protein
MNILKGIFYATMAWLILACSMSMIINGFTIEKFLLIIVSIAGGLWCYCVKNEEL